MFIERLRRELRAGAHRIERHPLLRSMRAGRCPEDGIARATDNQLYLGRRHLLLLARAERLACQRGELGVVRFLRQRRSTHQALVEGHEQWLRQRRPAFAPGAAVAAGTILEAWLDYQAQAIERAPVRYVGQCVLLEELRLLSALGVEVGQLPGELDAAEEQIVLPAERAEVRRTVKDGIRFVDAWLTEVQGRISQRAA